MGETEFSVDQNALHSLQNEVLPYFQQHQALTFLKERTEGYQAGLPTVAEEKREALTAYYADMSAYVQESRQQMNLSSNPQTQDFPQLDQYLNAKHSERDLDQDGSPERVDIDDQDSRVQVQHHVDRHDGVEQKTSIRERLRRTTGREKNLPNDQKTEKEINLGI